MEDLNNNTDQETPVDLTSTEQCIIRLTPDPEPEERLLDMLEVQRSLPLDECPVPVAFITGVAGTGKTTLVRTLIAKNEKWAVLTATTGIAAINLDATTLHSTLGFSDYSSLEDSFAAGYLASKLHKLGHEFENLLIDEVSMLDGRMLRLIYSAVEQVNNYSSMIEKGRRLGIILTGDFCQLPPIKAPWVFQDKDVWPVFEAHTLRLTKVWRQENVEFLKALGLLRAGDGSGAIEVLKPIVKWKAIKDHDFLGTTIVATNKEVEGHNYLALSKLPGQLIQIPSVGWGTLSNESPLRSKGSQWKNIPQALSIKEGAYVMILANSNSFGWSQSLEYANGSCGFVRGVNVGNKTVEVELTEMGNPTGKLVQIPRITRFASQKEEPNDAWDDAMGEWDGKSPYFDVKKRRWHMGGLTYMPLRLGYASTVHKCQGLTLDKVQIDSRAHFFGEPGMAYVAMSRCRTPEGTTVVGSPHVFATKVKIDERVRDFL